jgi:hypothetical protein
MKPIALSALAAVMVGLVLIGCQPKPAEPTVTVNPPSGSTGTTGTATAPDGTGTKSSTDAGEGSQPVANVEIPAELKATDAYRYYGFASDKPVDMQFERGDAPGTVVTGTAVMRAKEAKDGKVLFTIERTGGLGEAFGNEEVSLEKDGVYTLSSSKAKLGSDRTLELPATLEPGKTWDVTTTLSGGGKTITAKMKYKVVGKAKVDTKAGSYPDALLITSTGSSTMDGQGSTMTSKQWMVEGKGIVRMEIVSTPSGKGAKPSKSVLQETKPE